MPAPEDTDAVQARSYSGKGRRKDAVSAGSMLGRAAPHNIDAEEALLACCIIDAAETLSLCQEKGLRPESFYRPAHEIIFHIIEQMRRQNVGVDQITLANALAGRTVGTLPGRERDPDSGQNLFEYLGGHALLNQITSRIESTVNASFWLDIVFEKWVLRRLIKTATSVVEGCYTNEGQLDTFIDTVEQEIFKIGQDRVSDAAIPMSKSVEDATTLINKIMSGQASAGTPTGYKDLDRMTFGVHKGDMIVLAARPSMGKTSLAMNIAEQMAIPRSGDPSNVLVFSLEMGADQLAMRMLCRRARVNMRRVRDGTLGKEDMRNITTTAVEMKRAPLWIDDASHVTILELRAKARRMQSRLSREKGRLGLIVIDYLQLISGMGGNTPREQQISEISRGLKGLAKELEVPVLVLSQLNREAEKENRPPRLSDLRESGSIEQDADVVLLLAKDRESSDKSSVPAGTRKVELIIAKQRNGPVGSVDLTFIPEYTSFENYTESV
ncbi:MAG: replicative DNA helicase [Opitutales bacterium]|nr:replicative DNA helicase [Opitutales bacterium]